MAWKYGCFLSYLQVKSIGNGAAQSLTLTVGGSHVDDDVIYGLVAEEKKQ